MVNLSEIKTQLCVTSKTGLEPKGQIGAIVEEQQISQPTSQKKVSNDIVLPASVVSPMDVARLLREIEQIDDFFSQAEIRESGAPTNMPTNSRLMETLVNNNQLNLLEQQHRARLVQFLKDTDSSAPVVHMSFSVDPPGKLTQQLANWLRENIDSRTLITVGLQPNIGAGCVLRTTNKIFDLSLREFFTQKRQVFIDRMHIALTEVAKSDAPQPVRSVEA